MTAWCLRHDDCVLEVGGGIGMVSTMVQQILVGASKANHVVVEAQKQLCTIIHQNRLLHHSQFTAHHGALSKAAIYSCAETLLNGEKSKNGREWMFNAISHVAGEDKVKIPSLTPADLRKSVNTNFTALVVDCEGAFPGIVRDFPQILHGIRVIYVEQDGDKVEFDALEKKILKEGLVKVLSAYKHRVYHRVSFSFLRAFLSYSGNLSLDARMQARYTPPQPPP